MKKITARLLDLEGFTIQEDTDCESKKQAIAFCKYWLSDAYAESCETTHEALGTGKAEVLINGECEWDEAHENYYEREDTGCSCCGYYGGTHDDGCCEDPNA